MLLKIILAMVAFAANSLLCRLALKGLHMDAVSFSSIRLLSGAIALFLLLQIPGLRKKPEFNWLNAALLATYVFCILTGLFVVNHRRRRAAAVWHRTVRNDGLGIDAR